MRTRRAYFIAPVPDDASPDLHLDVSSRKAEELLALLLLAHTCPLRCGDGQVVAENDQDIERDRLLHPQSERSRPVYVLSSWLARTLEPEKGPEAARKDLRRRVEKLNECINRRLKPQTGADCWLIASSKEEGGTVSLDLSAAEVEVDLVTWSVRFAQWQTGRWPEAEEILSLPWRGPLLQDASRFAWMETEWFQELRSHFSREHAKFCYNAALRLKGKQDPTSAARLHQLLELAVTSRSDRYDSRLADLARAEGMSRKPRSRSRRLPAENTGLVGRDREIERVEAGLKEFRVVTLTGIGGCGKTQIALAVAHKFGRKRPDGCWWIDLTTIEPDRGKPACLGELLTAIQGEIQSVDECAEHIGDREILLVLDNCEHLVEVCRELVQGLQSCRRLQILLTSRTKIRGINGTVIDVPTLPVPPTMGPWNFEELAANPSVSYFIQRLRMSGVQLELSQEVAEDLVWVCRRLEGIPLLIELAAASATSGLKRLRKELPGLFQEGMEETAVLEKRQEKVSTCIRWSMGLLDASSQQLLGRLSVFAGTWDPDAACRVCADEELTVDEVRVALRVLIHSGLVAVEDPSSDHLRCLEPVRVVARKALERQQPEVMQSVRASYLDWMMDSAEQYGPWQIGISPPEHATELVEELEAYVEDLEQTQDVNVSRWARLTAVASYRWLAVGAIGLGSKRLRTLASRITESSLPSETRMSILLGQGAAAYFSGEWELALQLAEKSFSLADATRDQHATALAHGAVALLRSFIDRSGIDRSESEALVQRSLQLADKGDNPWTSAYVQLCAATYYWQMEELDRALQRYQISYEWFRRLDEKVMRSFSIGGLAHIRARQGATVEAARLYLESMDLSQQRKNARGMAGSVLGTCGVNFARGEWAEATRFLGAGKAAYAACGAMMIPPVQRDYEREAETLRQKLGEFEYKILLNSGSKLSLREACDAARQSLEIARAAR